MKKRKPKIGETLFLVDTGNMARDGRGRQRDCTVTRVGHKYFYVEYGGWCEFKFLLKTWKESSGYSADYILYESRQEWEDSCLITKYREAIFDNDSVYSATLSQLKQVAKILNITLGEDKT